MRIVLDLQACQTCSADTEGGRYSLSLARAIARRAGGVEIVVALNGLLPARIDALRQAFDGLLPRESVVVFSVPTSRAAPEPASVWRRRAAEEVRLGYLRGLGPDVVHASSLFVGLDDDGVASFGSTPHLFGASTVLTDVDFLGGASATDARLREWWSASLKEAERAELVLVTSEHARGLAIAALGLPEDAVVTVPAGGDERYEAGVADSPEDAVLLARLGLSGPLVLSRADEGDLESAERLIHAFALVPDAVRKGCQLALVATGLDDGRRAALEATVADFGLSGGSVVVLDGVDARAFSTLCHASTLVVVGSERECLGSSALAAMSCGASVIAANTGALPEVIDRADALFDVMDHHAIALSIERALTDDGFRTSLRDHCLKQAHRFSWDAAADRALGAFAELHERRGARSKSGTAAVRRPRLAFVSPLPPERSGIADYSAELLPELARYYDVDVVLNQARVDDVWVAANTAQRSASWFDAHASEYDRIVYQFGNSHYHEHMFALLARHPGVVVLHDFFLSGAIQHLDVSFRPPDVFRATLYASHGYGAIVDEQSSGREAACWRYPCNKQVLDRAEGVIVHSRYSMEQADAWYGAGYSREWQQIPLLRTPPPLDGRRAARQRLGLSDEDFLVCSFGMLGPTKLNDRLLDAWLDSQLAGDDRCRLTFVGQSHGGDYCESLLRTVERPACGGRVKVTGFAPRELYMDYLAAADAAVQLRTLSRGETSASVLDCLSRGIPTIVNAHGWVVELPQETVLRIADDFSRPDLVDALESIRRDPELRGELSRNGSEHVRTQHAPAYAGELYHRALERLALGGAGAGYRRIIRDLADIDAPTRPTRPDLIDVAASISANQAATLPRQLLVDVTTLTHEDLKTGIQRVSRAVLKALMDRPPDGFRVEPVREVAGRYVYARGFTIGLLVPNGPDLEDAPIEAGDGDIFLGLDLALHSVSQSRHALAEIRDRGTRVYFVLYDMLPVVRPDVFPDFIEPSFLAWLGAVTALSDGIVCISRTVADELVDWLDRTPPARTSQLEIGYFHLGADLAASLPTSGLEPDAAKVLRAVQSRPTFLMVGTVEPRKGHAQTLSAFEHLWADGVDAGLLIVGREGWNTQGLMRRLRTHPERGEHLLWLERVSDEMLLRLYASSAALLAASEGEGFGLPLVEAAQHGLPIVARDLPVFREVAGEHAFYFSGMAPEDLARGISEWLALRERGDAPASDGLPWLTWGQSTSQLLGVITEGQWYKRWSCPVLR